VGSLDLLEVNIIISISAFFTSLFVGVNTWNKRHLRGAFWFIMMVLAVCLVTLCYVFESAAGFDLDAYVSFSKIEYIGLSTIPLFWLGFALSYSGKERPLSPPSLVIISLIALMTIVLAFTNEWHGLIWAEPRFDPDYSYPVYAPRYGIWFWVYALYSLVPHPGAAGAGGNLNALDQQSAADF
jgi:hypothetical protein